LALFTQQNRNIKIQTPLGPDKLLLSSMNGSEGLSRLFSFELSLLSEDSKIVFKDIIGKSVTVSVEPESGETRYFNGIISRFSQISGLSSSTDDSTRVSQYSATLVPKLWLLTQSAECKIFQNKSVPEIVEAVLTGNGITDFTSKIQGSYENRDYCVQYRESHFTFISRLLENEGIHYYFEHKDQNHRLVLSDAPRANDPTPLLASYQVEGSNPDDAVIHSIDWSQEIRPNKYGLSDFNFETPNNSLKADIPGKYRLSSADLEIYDYPGIYSTKAAGDKMVRVRIEEEEAQVTSISGSGNCVLFIPGYRFTLLNSYRSDMNNKEFLLTSVTHAMNQSYEQGGGFDYENTFTCIPADVPFRPPRSTPKPVVRGAQTAIVAGPPGEEIHTDKYGRVKVQFHWDRVGQRNDTSSCWIRVAQSSAGTGWGTIYIPRIGQEVIVDFIEGDPDRPLITGSVYHTINMPPYRLPAEKTKSSIKSNSSPGGGGCNEIRFEDKKGEEQLFIQAEKQQDHRVKKDSLEWVGNERHLIVTKDQLEKVGGDQHLTVLGDRNEKVDGTVSLKIGRDLQQKVGVMHALDAGQDIHLKAGMQVVIEAGAQLTLKVGGSFIDIGPAGVTIKGAMVMINSGGVAGYGSGASPEAAKDPKEADRADPGTSDKPAPSQSVIAGPQAAAYKSAAESGAPFCDT
jgi:type VI secretion system secreted protein VgrG